jgi:hypothetical protein
MQFTAASYESPEMRERVKSLIKFVDESNKNVEQYNNAMKR